jgi:hypothetical protein
VGTGPPWCPHGATGTAHAGLERANGPFLLRSIYPWELGQENSHWCTVSDPVATVCVKNMSSS